MKKLNIDPHMPPRYKVLQLLGSSLSFGGWIEIVLSLIGAVYASVFWQDELNGFAMIGASVIILFFAITQGIMMIAFGQLITLFVDMSEDVHVSSRELLKFFAWYSEKE